MGLTAQCPAWLPPHWHWDRAFPGLILLWTHTRCDPHRGTNRTNGLGAFQCGPQTDVYPKLEQFGSSVQSEAKSVCHHVTSAQGMPVPTPSSCGSALLGLSWYEQDTSGSVILGPRGPHSPSVPSKTPRTTACTPPGLSSLSESRCPQSRRSQAGAALAPGDLCRGAEEQGKESICTQLCQPHPWANSPCSDRQHRTQTGFELLLHPVAQSKSGINERGQPSSA